MLSLDLTEWLKWKCNSAAQSVGFLCRVVASLRSATLWICMSRKDISCVECSKVNFIVEWRLFFLDELNQNGNLNYLYLWNTSD